MFVILCAADYGRGGLGEKGVEGICRLQVGRERVESRREVEDSRKGWRGGLEHVAVGRGGRCVEGWVRGGGGYVED